MQADFFNQIRDELTSFSQELDSKTGDLLKRRLISIEELERLKKSASVYTEYLDRALRDSSLASTQKALIEAYVKDYKVRMTQELEKFWSRLYSDENIKNELKKCINYFRKHFAKEHNQEKSDFLGEKLKKLEIDLWTKFKNELKNRGESQRYKVGEEILEELLESLQLITDDKQLKLLSSNESVADRHKTDREPHNIGEEVNKDGVTPKIETNNIPGEEYLNLMSYLTKVRRHLSSVFNHSRSHH